MFSVSFVIIVRHLQVLNCLGCKKTLFLCTKVSFRPMVVSSASISILFFLLAQKRPRKIAPHCLDVVRIVRVYYSASAFFRQSESLLLKFQRDLTMAFLFLSAPLPGDSDKLSFKLMV